MTLLTTLWSLSLLAALVILSVNSTDCPRHRKPWSLLTQYERGLYVEGFQNIRKNGKLDIITSAHATPEVGPYVHSSSLFSYWHDYLVWEVETAIRDLGGKFSCFGMPLWDWTLDAGLEGNPPILSSGIGGDGDKYNEYCVTSDGTDFNWDLCSNTEQSDLSEQCYWSPFTDYCAASESIPYCCLKRIKSTTILLTTAAEIGELIESSPNFEDFQTYINIWHNKCHILLAADIQAHMVDGFAPDDPAFMMLHAYVGYLRALWADCWDYNDIPLNELDYNNDAYTIYCGAYDGPQQYPSDCPDYKLGLDDAFKLYDLEQVEWSLVGSGQEITVRKMWDPRQWNVVYELGPFYTNSGLNKWCANNLDSDWFVDTIQFDTDTITMSPVNKYSMALWKELKGKGMKESEIFKVVAASSCDYTRRNSKNSCWTEDMLQIDKEICDTDKTEQELENLSLDDMLNMEGVRDNDCLKQIRKEIFPYTQYFKYVKKILCAGEYDYKCPQYVYDEEQYVINNQLKYGYSVLFYDNAEILMIFGVIIFFICIGVVLMMNCFKSQNIKTVKTPQYGSI